MKPTPHESEVHDGRAGHPRVRLMRAPTAIEHCPRLTAAVGGAEIWVKRDDETGLAFGGNKVRQLEYYLGAALAEDADTLLITGAVQSNFVRLAAAAAARLGLTCHVQLEARVATDDPAYHASGNVLLDHLLGATVHTYPDGEDEAGADAQLARIAEDLRAKGARPYVIPLAPGHPPLGALGYIDAAEEIISQCRLQTDIPDAFDEIVVGSGSGATHGGLLYGLRCYAVKTPVHGACVRRASALQTPRIISRLDEIATLCAEANPATADDVTTDDSFLAPGYGKASADVVDAISTAARTEALICDPTYMGKVMAVALSRARNLGAGARLLVIHTGGTPGLFANPDLIDRRAAPPAQ
ncbi:MAG: D-cysteine desulfhydrase family protein [Pseudomonadota bacterium]